MNLQEIQNTVMGTSSDLSTHLINLTYLVASILFILGLKGLTHPRTAPRGNMLGALGMLVAVVATLFSQEVLSFKLIALGVVIGSVIGGFLAIKIAMTDMPQLVALFNGFGGLASTVVAGAALVAATDFPAQMTVSIVASGLIGTVTFSGSLVAFVKLQELFWTGSVRYPLQKPLNLLMFLAVLGIGALIVIQPPGLIYYSLLVAVALVLGVTLVLPIGGADMPVVIALLNSYSGLAASATGFVLGNNVLIIAGSLVGASGLILTRIMCVAMNRSLVNVLFGTFGEEGTGPTADADEMYAGRIKATNGEEVAMLLDTADLVCIIPGYGMAVAQAQHAVRDLANALKARGTEVVYGIHPVAGRMPGHMNVLLAEADVPYEELIEMEMMNPRFDQVDVSIVLGANDVVNPEARTNPQSPIAGMPILDVDKSRTVVVIKRSLSPGFAGIPNPLFAMDNTLMFFGDGKKAIIEATQAVKEL